MRSQNIENIQKQRGRGPDNNTKNQEDPMTATPITEKCRQCNSGRWYYAGPIKGKIGVFLIECKNCGMTLKTKDPVAMKLARKVETEAK